MQWEWEEICELPDSSPHQRYGNWETADGMSFFCQWVDVCPPREDALRGPSAPCFVTLMETMTNMASTISTTLIFSVCMFMCFYVLPCISVCPSES